MTDFPMLKMKTLVNFPANAYGGNGINVAKAAGAFTLNIDYSRLSIVGALPPNMANYYTLTWNSATNSYQLFPMPISGGTSPSTAAPLMDGVAAPGVSIYFACGDHVHPSDTSRAPLASPVFTGNPQAPTPLAGDNSVSIATTAFAAAAISTSNGIYRAVTTGGPVTIAANDRAVAIYKTTGAPTAVTLPLAASKNGPVIISDFKRDGATNNITITPSGAELIQGLASFTLAANGASVQLFPIPGVGYSL
jgi:hypothetical protein